MKNDIKYARWHQLVHDWSFCHFSEPAYGEWYGYLHRDGTVSQPAIDHLYKGPFHLARMLWYCCRHLEPPELLAAENHGKFHQP